MFFQSETEVGGALFSALSGSGFAYLTGHGISEREAEGLFRAARDFFRLPEVRETLFFAAHTSSPDQELGLWLLIPQDVKNRFSRADPLADQGYNRAGSEILDRHRTEEGRVVRG